MSHHRSNLIYPNANGIVDMEGFKICVEDLINSHSIPKFFNSPLMCTWEITRECNLNCIHCYNNSKKRLTSELSTKYKINLAKQLVDMKIFRICISGGEPILSESFWKIAEIFKQGNVMCNTITNGYFINESVAKKMSKYFNSVQVSIDGITPKVHDAIRGVKGSWNRAIKACKNLVANDVNLMICFVPLLINIHQISKMIDLAFKLGATSFRIERTRLTGRAIKNLNLMPSEESYKNFEKIIDKKRKEYEGKMRVEYTRDYPLIYNQTARHLPPMFCWITPSGVITLNNTLPFSGGSIKNKSFKDIWNYLKECHLNEDFLKALDTVKCNNDYLTLDEIPYSRNEMYD